MKSDETFKTKSESGADEFEVQRKKQEAKSAQAARAATASQRDAADGKQPFKHLVRVRATDRPGLDGMRRGGHFWPSDPAGRVARVTPRLYAAIRAESLLHVESDPDGVDPKDDHEQLDVPERHRVTLPEVAGTAAAASPEDMAGMIAAGVAAALKGMGFEPPKPTKA